jgi:hypothetical protein
MRAEGRPPASHVLIKMDWGIILFGSPAFKRSPQFRKRVVWKPWCSGVPHRHHCDHDTGIPSVNTVTWCAVSSQILVPSKFWHYSWFEGLGINDERQGKLGGNHFKWAAELSGSVREHELNRRPNSKLIRSHYSGRSPNDDAFGFRVDVPRFQTCRTVQLSWAQCNSVIL